MNDAGKIAELYDSYSKELSIFIWNIVKSAEETEDILQETFIRLVSYIEKKQIYPDNPRAFLYRIARNLSIDHYRKFKAVTEITEEIPARDRDLLNIIVSDEITRSVYTALDSLDPEVAEVFMLRKEGKMHFSDIAESLKISERTAKRHMQKALTHMEKYLKNSGLLD